MFSVSGKVDMFAGRMLCVRLMEREWEELFLNSWSPFAGRQTVALLFVVAFYRERSLFGVLLIHVNRCVTML